MIAYAAYYGKQPLSEIHAMGMSELQRFVAAIGRIIEKENTPSKG